MGIRMLGRFGVQGSGFQAGPEKELRVLGLGF